MSKHSQILELARQLVAALEASAPAPRKKAEPKAPDVSASSDAVESKPKRKPAAKKAPSPPVVPEPSA